MILQPIRQQKVLPTKFTQNYLPPVTVDTSNIRKQIEQMYSRTIVLPETQSVEVKNFIETPQGYVLQPSPSPVQQTIPSVQSMSIPSEVPTSQPLITQSYNPQLITSTPTSYQSIVPGSTIYPTNDRQLLLSRLIPNQTLYNVYPVSGFNPGNVSPTI